MKNLDPQNTYAALTHFADQCEQAWRETKKLRIYKFAKLPISNVVIAGMGGSAIAPETILTALADRLVKPVTLVRGYDLPRWVDQRTLVIASSYSGTTEETISVARLAIKRKASVVGIAVGGALVGVLKKARQPVYVFDPKYNPGNQPRFGTGYLAFATLALLKNAGALAVTDQEVAQAVSAARGANERLGKKLADSLVDRFPLFVGAEHLSGAAHVVQNRVNESAKHLAFYQLLPELNHHLMEGFRFPHEVTRRITAVFFSSNLYNPRVRARVPITMDVVKKNGARAVEVAVAGPTKLAQAVSLVALGGYLSYHLAMKHKVDPSKIKWVDYFKKKLGR